MSVGFRGVVLSAPGIASYIDDSQATSFVTATPNAVAIVGVAERGQPGVALAFSDAASAAAAYGGGGTNYPLVDGISRALAAGAGIVYGVRVGTSTAATASLTKSSAEAVRVVTNEYGKFAKSYYLVIETGTTGKKATLYLYDGKSYAVDNITKGLMKIIGSGSATGTATISNTGISLTSTSTFVGSSITASGLTINTTVSGTVITAGTVAAGGTNYNVGDIVSVTGGGGTGATFSIATVSSGAAVTLTLISGGTGYTANATTATTVTTTTLTVGTISTGAIRVGDVLGGAVAGGSTGTIAGKVVLSYATGTGGVGTYRVTYEASNTTTIAAGTSVQSATFLFADYAKLDNIVSIINSTFATTAAGFVSSVLSGVSGSKSTAALDQVTGAVIPASSGTALQLNADSQAMVDALNGDVLGNWVTATRTNNLGAIDNGTYGFTGAADNAITDSDWLNALVVLQNVPAYFVVPMTSSALYHKSALAHAEYMSAPGGRYEKLVVCGGDVGETAAQAITASAALNSKRAVRVWPGVKDYDTNGDLQTYPPYYAAAQIAGILATQNDPAEPLTNKTFGIAGIETSSSLLTIDNLVNNGVFTYKNVSGRGFVFVQSLTTWTGDTKFARREISTVRAADEVVKRVRTAISGSVGAKSTLFLQASITTAVQGVLADAEQNGLIVADPTNPGLFPAYKNLVVRVSGDAYYVDFNISPAKPANYVLITAYVS